MSDKKILVADDDPKILVLLEKELLQEGYQVILASSGEEALEKAVSQVPDVILMDLMMEGVTGADAVKRIHEIPELDRTRIIFLTGMLSKSEESQQLGITVDEEPYPTFAKPLDMKRLKSCLAQM